MGRYRHCVSYSPIPGPVTAVGPPLPSNPQGPYGPTMRYRTPMAVKARKVGAPLALLIILGILVGVAIAVLTALNPMLSIVALLLASIALVLVVLAYLWLDRFEPEPPRLLIFAFLWGAVVATTLSLLLENLLGLLGDLGLPKGFAGTALEAPAVEELMKGSFLLLMLTGRRRAEMNSLTDCLIYAGLAAAGFAWLEDFLYVSQGGSLGGALFTALLRLVLGPFAHPLFTTMTALGVWFAMKQKGTGAKVGLVAAGFVCAMVLHGLWNGSTFLFNGMGYFVVYALVMVPVFVLMIVVAVKTRKREQAMAAAKLPGMLAVGLIWPSEVAWLQSLKTRKLALAEAGRLGGPAAVRSVKLFIHAVVELAFVRDRIDRGFGNQQVFNQQQSAAQAVVYSRETAPVLEQMVNFRLPALPGPPTTGSAPQPYGQQQGYPHQPPQVQPPQAGDSLPSQQPWPQPGQTEPPDRPYRPQPPPATG